MATLPPEDDEKQSKFHSGDFCELVETIGHGCFKDKVESLLGELVDAVKETGKDGQLTIKLKLKKAGEHCSVKADATITRPQHPTPESVFFFGQKGRIHRDNPRQTRLKQVPAAPPALRTVKPTGGGDGEGGSNNN